MPACWPCCVACLCCLVAVPVAFIAAPQFIEKHDRFEQNTTDADGYLRTPANDTETMWFPSCVDEGFKKAMAKYNSKRPYKLVKYKSTPGKDGQDVVELTAWWLPADDKDAPRIVVQHGNNVNFNDWTVNIIAYFLRNMGFSVLMPNLRDHGSSGNSSHAAIGWAWDYYLDVDAAWNYAMSDPNGELGGKIAKNKVGIYGQSMGGLASSIAFGLLKDAPGLWLDSAVFSPKQVFQYQIQNGVPSFLSWSAWFAVEPAWMVAKFQTGVDLDGLLPAVALADGPRRRVAVVHAKDDTIVPFNQAESYKAYFDEQKYFVNEYFTPEKAACGTTTHISMEVVYSEEYYNKMCIFWTDVFNTAHTKCKKNSVPKATLDPTSRLYAESPALFAGAGPSPVSLALVAASGAALAAAAFLAVRRGRAAATSGAEEERLVDEESEMQ